jgi:hypothetical protein
MVLTVNDDSRTISKENIIIMESSKNNFHNVRILSEKSNKLFGEMFKFVKIFERKYSSGNIRAEEFQKKKKLKYKSLRYLKFGQFR